MMSALTFFRFTDPPLSKDSKGVIKSGKVRNTDNASESQKGIYHLALLTLNLGAINREPLTGGRNPARIQSAWGFRIWCSGTGLTSSLCVKLAMRKAG